MPLFTSQRIGAMALAGLAVVVSLFGYTEWSSNARWAEFMAATTVSDLDRSTEAPPSMQSDGRTGCPQGKRKLPTQIMPLP
jgi:hypothetical protein